jgi:hypothetical protein
VAVVLDAPSETGFMVRPTIPSFFALFKIFLATSPAQQSIRVAGREEGSLPQGTEVSCKKWDTKREYRGRHPLSQGGLR